MGYVATENTITVIITGQPISVSWTGQSVTVSNATLAVTQSGSWTVKPTKAVIITEDESWVPTSVAAGTAETIEVTGTTTLTSGQLIKYNMAIDTGAIATAAGEFIYVALKGATSNKYFARCVYPHPVYGEFYVSSSEKINIVARNSDATDAHIMSAYWQAVS